MSWTLDTEFIEPTALTAVIREALADLQINRFTLSRWLPNVEIDDIVFDFTTGGGGLAEASVYRSWDAESRIGRREGLSKVMGELPPISEKIVLNEYDRLRLRKLDNPDALPFLVRDAERLATNIAARFEVARGQALVNGSVPVDELQQTISFGRSGSHSVVAATLWSDHTNATPIDDLESWVQTYVDTNGQAPGITLMSRQVVQNMRQCTQMIRQVFPLAPTGVSPMISRDQLNAVLESMDLPPIEIYDAQVKVDGSTTRITPSNSLALLPPPGATDATAPTDLGATLLGTTAESQEPEYGLAPGEQAGIVAGMWKTKDPVRLWSHAAAIGIPIVREPNLTFKAQVLA